MVVLLHFISYGNIIYKIIAIYYKKLTVKDKKVEFSYYECGYFLYLFMFYISRTR